MNRTIEKGCTFVEKNNYPVYSTIEKGDYIERKVKL